MKPPKVEDDVWVVDPADHREPPNRAGFWTLALFNPTSLWIRADFLSMVPFVISTATMGSQWR